MIADLISHDAFIFIWSISVLATVTLAMGKARHPVLWLLVALAAGPLAILLLLRLPHGGHDPATGIEPQSMDLCRHCLEPVRCDSPTCRYCGTHAPVVQP